jgi:hypothetical protein
MGPINSIVIFKKMDKRCIGECHQTHLIFKMHMSCYFIKNTYDNHIYRKGSKGSCRGRPTSKVGGSLVISIFSFLKSS